MAEAPRLSIVRQNLLEREGYSPYCGAESCLFHWPRTRYVLRRNFNVTAGGDLVSMMSSSLLTRLSGQTPLIEHPSTIGEDMQMERGNAGSTFNDSKPEFTAKRGRHG